MSWYMANPYVTTAQTYGRMFFGDNYMNVAEQINCKRHELESVPAGTSYVEHACRNAPTRDAKMMCYAKVYVNGYCS